MKQYLAKTGVKVKPSSTNATQRVERKPLSQPTLGTLRLGGSLQENILTLLVHSDKHGQEIINLIDESFFEGDYRLIAHRAMAFWKKERRAPREHMPDLLDNILRDAKNRRKELIASVLRNMFELAPKINTNFAMNGLREFCEKQKDKKFIIKAAELAGREETTHEEIIELAREHIRTVGAPPKGFTWEAPDYSLPDDRRGNLPEFPLDAIPSKHLKRWLTRAAKGTATSVAHVAVPFLGVAASLIGSARRVNAKGFIQPLAIWVAMVGRSGSGKTPGIDAVRNPLVNLQFEREQDVGKLRREHARKVEHAKVACATWKAQVKMAVDNKKPSPPKPPEAEEPDPFIEPKLFVTEATIEKLGLLLQARWQGTLLLIDELAGWFSGMSRYSGGGQDNQFWLMSWDGKPFTLDRVGRRALMLKNLLISVVGGLQPDKLAAVFKGDADGMYARFLYAWPEKPPYQPLTGGLDPVDHDMQDILDKLARLGDTRDKSVELPLSSKALKAFEDIRYQVSDMVRLLDGREQEWWAKVEAQTLRLAGTRALLYWTAEGGREPTEIIAEDINAAIRLIREYFWPHARAALRQIGLSPRHSNARRVLRWLANKGDEQAGVDDIRIEALGRTLNATETRTLMESLSKAGWVREDMVKPIADGVVKAGRPKIVWFVNPKLFAKEEDQREDDGDV